MADLYKVRFRDPFEHRDTATVRLWVAGRHGDRCRALDRATAAMAAEGYSDYEAVSIDLVERTTGPVPDEYMSIDFQTGSARPLQEAEPQPDKPEAEPAAEVRQLVEELHTRMFGDNATVSFHVRPEWLLSAAEEDWALAAADIDRAQWIVERLRVLTDGEYADATYGEER